MDEDQLSRFAEYCQTHDFSADLERAEPDATVVADPMITTSLWLPKPIMDAIRSAAEARGVRATVLMGEWLEQRLAQQAETGE